VGAARRVKAVRALDPVNVADVPPITGKAAIKQTFYEEGAPLNSLPVMDRAKRAEAPSIDIGLAQWLDSVKPGDIRLVRVRR
jgi:hypothetical protein